MSELPPDSHSVPLERAASKINILLTYGQACALLTVAAATVVGITSVILGMFDARSAGLADLLMLFLYVEILSMVKGSALGTREIPIRMPVALAIVAVARYIVVDIEHMTPNFMLLTSSAILVLVIALWVLNRIPPKH